MSLSTVTWRQVLAAIAAALVSLGAVVVLVRSGGLDAIDATAGRATRWFVGQGGERVVLADGYRGRVLATLDPGSPGEALTVAQGGSGAYLLDPATGEVRVIDSATLRIGPPVALAELGADQPVVAAGASGLVVVDRTDQTAAIMPPGGDPVTFDVRVEPGADVLVAPDGAVWSVVGDQVERRTSTGATTLPVGVDAVELSLVGSRPLLLDRAARRVRFDDGRWIALPSDVVTSEIVVQEPGPGNDCGWVGAGEELWCIGPDGPLSTVSVPGLGLGGGDQLAIGGDAAVVVDPAGPEIVRFDWRRGEILQNQQASVSSDASLQVTATADMVWIDDVNGRFVRS